MNDAITGNNAFENGILMLIGKEFGGAASGFDVVWEAKRYKPSKFGSEILKSINKQALGYEPKIAEVWFRRQYLCDVSEDMTPEKVKQTIEEYLMTRIIKKGGV